MKNKITKTTAIIFARMRSTRLPGKVLKKLNGKSSIWWMVNRCLSAKYVDDVIIATTSNSANDPIRDHVNKYFGNSNQVSVFSYSGAENNCIERMIAAAQKNKTDIIVDLTCDCPLVDPRHIDYLYETLIKNDVDYVSNCVTRSWPDGFDIQVYGINALKECNKIFTPDCHVGINLALNPEYFEIMNWPASPDMHYPDWGLTLDTPEDYELLKKVFDKFGHDVFFKVEDVVYWLNENPELLKINSNIKRKSIEEG